MYRKCEKGLLNLMFKWVLIPACCSLSILLGIVPSLLKSQSTVSLYHQVKIGTVPLVLGEWQTLNGQAEIKIDKLRWYISLTPINPSPVIENSLSKNHKRKKHNIFNNVPQVWLLDLSDTASLKQTLLLPIPTHMPSNKPYQLLFGIDSSIQVNGVGTGALDPIRGMYWTWQTGYVQWKMEGSIRVNGVESPLELHLGGFEGSTKTQMPLSMESINERWNSVVATWDLSDFLAYVVSQKKYGVMSPSPIARDYCRIIANGVSFHN